MESHRCRQKVSHVRLRCTLKEGIIILCAVNGKVNKESVARCCCRCSQVDSSALAALAATTQTIQVIQMS